MWRYKKKSFEDNKAKKVTTEQCLEIQSLKGKEKQAVLAERFGLSQSRICQIMRGDFFTEED